MFYIVGVLKKRDFLKDYNKVIWEGVLVFVLGFYSLFWRRDLFMKEFLIMWFLYLYNWLFYLDVVYFY